MYQKIQKSPSDNYPTQLQNSQLAQRSTAQAKQNSPKPVKSENEKEVFEQDRSEVSQLQLKEKSGTLTSQEQQKLGVLQAKMNDSWVQRREKASQFGHNIANIPISSTATIQKRESKEPRPNKTGLPDDLKLGVEALSGYSMDDIEVNYNSSKPSQIQAYAYAQGNQIDVAPGQGKHLPHEAWHPVQNKQGRVKPTRQTKGVQINDDLKLEKEADVMGAKALRLGQKLQSEEAVQRSLQPEEKEQQHSAIETSFASGGGGVFQGKIDRSPQTKRDEKMITNMNVLAPIQMVKPAGYDAADNLTNGCVKKKPPKLKAGERAGGFKFGNYDQKLPSDATYIEYDVNPKIEGQNRDAERVVKDSNGKIYYTDDHYNTFTEIK